MPQNKHELRKKYLSKPGSVTPVSLISHAQSLITYLTGSNIALYFPFADEPDLIPILKANISKNFCMPKVKGEELKFVSYKAGDEACNNPRFSKIIEPSSEEIIIPDIMFVPGIAFDIKGNRLGRGMGFYDKYIAQHPKVKIIGVTFQEKLLESLPTENHDCRMHYIITEHDIIFL